MSLDPAVIAAIALGGLVLGVVIGRLTAGSSGRLNELQTRIEGITKERDLLQSEVSAAKDAAKQLREDHESYRLQVADHFSGTSELLRDMTQQYRAVYDHLTQGAGALCPEGFVLEPGPAPDALPSGPEAAAGSEPAPEEETGEGETEPAPEEEGEARSR